MLLAEIFSGERDTADLFFLFATILLVIAFVLTLSTRPDPTKGSLFPLGVACVAFALLLL